MELAVDISRASLDARERLKDLRNMAASMGCPNQARVVETAIASIKSVEDVLTMVVSDKMRGAA